MQNIVLRVNLSVFEDNLRALRARLPAKLILMTKSNAYGHGAAQIAASAEPYVYGFGVATVDEGVLLRESGITKPILVCAFSAEDADEAVKNDLICGVFEPSQVKALAKYAGERNTKAKIHLKLDTGMHRLGLSDEVALARLLSEAENSKVELCGVYSHVGDRTIIAKHKDSFLRLASKVKRFYPQAILHLASGGIALERSELCFDAVRVGLSAYGYSDCTQPIMTAYSRVLSVGRVEAGERVGYEGALQGKPTGLAVVCAGYADGVPRHKNAYFLLGEKVCRVAALPCMDTTIVDVGDYIPRVGDRITIMQNAEQLAEATERIPYEILTGFHNRCGYEYVRDRN